MVNGTVAGPQASPTPESMTDGQDTLYILVDKVGLLLPIQSALLRSGFSLGFSLRVELHAENGIA